MVVSTTEPPPTESATVKEGLRVFKLVMYITIFIVSVLLNSFMLLALWRKFRRHRRTAKSFIILMQNLGVSGLVLVVASIPFDAVSQDADSWPFGAGGCKILYPLQTVALQAMVFTYVALAYHRWYGVTRDLFGQMKFILALVLTFVIWISSIIIVVPYVLSLDYNYINKTCDELWSTDGSRQGYTISLFLLDYALPLIALLVMYVMVWGRMQSYRVVDPERAARRERHCRIIRMMVAYVLSFAVFLLPHQIMWLILDFANGEKKLYFRDVLNIVYIFTYAITIINPILFFIYNPEFKRHLLHYLKCQCFVRRELFSMENLSESFSEEFDPKSRRPNGYRTSMPPKYEMNEVPKENNYASTPSMLHTDGVTLPRYDSGLGLVEAGLFPSAVDRLRTAGKYKESTPSTSPPGSDVVSYTDRKDSLDQGSEML